MPQDLFIEAPTFIKVSSVKLSEDVAQWPLEITQHLHEEHPYLAESEAEVVIKKQDALRGYGYGFLKIGDNIKVPIIVNQYQMSPLDVWLDNDGKAQVLDEDAIKAATQKTTLGKVIKPQTAGYVDSLIYSRTYPPYDGKYVYAAAGKDFEVDDNVRRQYVSVLSAIPMDEMEKKAAIESLSESVIAGMHMNGTDVSVLKEWIHDGFEKVASDWEKTARGMSDCDSPIPDAVIKEDMNIGSPEAVSKFGHYIVEGRSGERYEGHVFPHVYDFDLNRQSMTLFKGRWIPDRDKYKSNDYPIGSKSCSSLQSAIAGISIPVNDKVYDDYPRSNDRGFFVKERADAAIALIPVTILAVSKTREHHETKKENEDYSKRVKIETDYDITKYHCKTDLGGTLTIIKSPNTIDIKRDGKVVYIPSSMVFCRMTTPITLKDDPDMIKKAAEADYGVNDLEIRHHEGLFGFQGTNVTGYELQAGVSQAEAQEFLESTWTKEASEKIIERAKQGDPGKATIIHVVIPVPEFSKTADDHTVEFNEEGVVLTDREAIAKRIQLLTQGFDKIAASLQDAGLVDNVLSLKFVNKQNISKYAEFVPQFEEVVSHLADLLVAARVGLQIEEDAVKTAMNNMAMVVRDLKTIKGN